MKGLDGRYWLDCPCCGEDAFGRDVDEYGEDEQEVCTGCGCTLTIGVDDSGDPPRAYVTASEDCAGESQPAEEVER